MVTQSGHCVTLLDCGSASEVEVKLVTAISVSGNYPNLSSCLHLTISMVVTVSASFAFHFFFSYPGKLGVFLDLSNGLFISRKFQSVTQERRLFTV